jgi:hypothetical protein
MATLRERLAAARENREEKRARRRSFVEAFMASVEDAREAGEISDREIALCRRLCLPWNADKLAEVQGFVSTQAVSLGFVECLDDPLGFDWASLLVLFRELMPLILDLIDRIINR